MNILVGIRGKGDTADSYYRAIAPWSLVRYWTNHQIRVEPLSSDGVRWADVVVFQRSASAEEELLMHEAKGRGKAVVYDCDDNLFDVPPSAGELYTYYWTPGVMKPKPPLLHHARMLGMADLVTVPTQALGDLLCQHTGRPLNVRVLPNCVMRGDWDLTLPMHAQHPDGDAETVTVGWMGHLYHWDDFQMIKGALEDVICAENARLVILGFPELTRLFSPRLLERTRIEPCLPFAQMGAVRQAMRTFDVGILPLADTPFNRGKSPLKAFQMGAAGVPCVASPTVYGEVVADLLPEAFPDEGGALRIARSQADWVEILSYLIHSPTWRRMMACAWQQEVWKRHCYESVIEVDGKDMPQAMLWLQAAEEAVRCA